MSYGPGWELHLQQQAAKRARAVEAGRQRRAAAKAGPAAPGDLPATLARIEAALGRIEAALGEIGRRQPPAEPLVGCVAPLGSAIGPALAEAMMAEPLPAATADVTPPPRWGLRWRERAADGGWQWIDRWWTGEVTRIGQPRTTDDPAMIGRAGLFEDEDEAEQERRARGYGQMRPCPLPEAG